MKRALFAVHCTVYLLTLGSFLLITKPLFRALYYPTGYQIYCAPYLSPVAHDLLARTVGQFSHLPAEALSAQLKNNLPWIDTMQIVKQFNGDAQLHVKPYLPLCLLNDSPCLLINSLPVDASLFEQNILQLIPQLTVKSSLTAEQIRLIVEFMQKQVTPETLDSCALTWYAPHALEYRPSKGDFTVIAHDKQLLNGALLERCGKAIELFKNGNKNKKIRGSDLIADIRFAGQIIVRVKERESNEAWTLR